MTTFHDLAYDIIRYNNCFIQQQKNRREQDVHEDLKSAQECVKQVAQMVIILNAAKPIHSTE
jgi:hypothetical protein